MSDATANHESGAGQTVERARERVGERTSAATWRGRLAVFALLFLLPLGLRAASLDHGLPRGYVPDAHIVRNALDHGLESPDERTAAGKPPEGLLEVSAGQEGSQVIIRIEDDGGGIDAIRIQSLAVERGILDPQAAAELDPDFQEAHHNAGVALHILGRLDEAEAALLRALELEPNDRFTHGTLGAVQIDQGHLDKGIDTLERAAQHPGLESRHGFPQGLGAGAPAGQRVREAAQRSGEHAGGHLGLTGRTRDDARHLVLEFAHVSRPGIGLE